MSGVISRQGFEDQLNCILCGRERALAFILSVIQGLG